VGPGYVIIAIVGADKIATTTTDDQGRYGYDPVFELNAKPGVRVQFSINGTPAIQSITFQEGTSTRLDLRGYGVASRLQHNVLGSSCVNPYQPTYAALSTSSCGINPKTMPSGAVGATYSVTLQTSGGVLPYTWDISGGSLPPGLSMDGSGVIYGVPETAGTFSFTVMVNDSARNYQSLDTFIVISAGSKQSPTNTITTWTAASVSSNFLGKTGSVPITNGVVTDARVIASNDDRVRLSLPQRYECQ